MFQLVKCRGSNLTETSTFIFRILPVVPVGTSAHFTTGLQHSPLQKHDRTDGTVKMARLPVPYVSPIGKSLVLEQGTVAAYSAKYSAVEHTGTVPILKSYHPICQTQTGQEDGPF